MHLQIVQFIMNIMRKCIVTLRYVFYACVCVCNEPMTIASQNGLHKYLWFGG